jgi:hypothetical protein
MVHPNGILKQMWKAVAVKHSLFQTILNRKCIRQICAYMDFKIEVPIKHIFINLYLQPKGIISCSFPSNTEALNEIQYTNHNGPYRLM